MPKDAALDLVLVIAALSLAGLLLDGGLSLWRRIRRLRRSQGGAVGVVVDHKGRILGTYLDPFAHPWRAARMHGSDSAWNPAGIWGESGFTWEGFGETEEEALTAANRLRRRHLQLFRLRSDQEIGDR